MQWKRTGDPIPRVYPTMGQHRPWVTSQGYLMMWMPDHPLAWVDGYVAEHRRVAWDAGLFDDPALIVHHKDEDKSNNDVSNLEPKTPSRHMSEHVHERGYVRNQYGVWKVTPQP